MGGAAARELRRVLSCGCVILSVKEAPRAQRAKARLSLISHISLWLPVRTEPPWESRPVLATNPIPALFFLIASQLAAGHKMPP